MEIGEFLNGDTAALRAENPHGIFVTWNKKDTVHNKYDARKDYTYSRNLAEDMTAILNRGCQVELVKFLTKSGEALLKITWK